MENKRSIDSKKAYHNILWFLLKHPVRKEHSFKRSLEFSQWLRKYCRPSSSYDSCQVAGIELARFVAFDLDFVLYDYERKMLQLLEVKTHNGRPSGSQRKTFGMLNQILALGAPLAGVQYLGLHYLIMDAEQPFESENITWDGVAITQEECWRRVNMFDAIEANL